MQSTTVPSTDKASAPLCPDVARFADRMSVELIAGRVAEVKRQISGSGAGADAFRRQVQSVAERRKATSSSGKHCMVRLYAWPMLVSFDTEKQISTRPEPALYVPNSPAHAAVASKIRQFWTNAFVGSGAAEVLPLPRAVHLNAVMCGDPFKVHRCVFSGASLLEGRRPGEFFFTRAGNTDREAVGGPVAAPYMLLAYAATHAGTADPKPRVSANDHFVAQQVFSAMMGVSGGTAKVQLFEPQGYFAALERLHLEQIWHFVEWADVRGLNPQVEVSEELEPTGVKRLVTISHTGQDGDGSSSSHTWAFDSAWRPTDTFQDMLESIHARRKRLRSSASASTQNMIDSIFKTVH